MMSSQTLPAPRTGAEERVVALLRAHVPLSLLLDLAEPDPRSRELYARERDENEWVTPS